MVKKIVYCFLLFIVALNISGCAVISCAVLENAEPEKIECRDKQKTFKISVESSVNDAKVYLDGECVAEIPVKTLKLEVNYKVCRGYKTFPWKHGKNPWVIKDIEPHTLAIKKDGYQSQEVDLDYVRVGRVKFKLADKKFYFQLQEEGNKAVYE